MAGIQGLVETIQSIMQKKVAEEARARHGTIQDGKFKDGNNFYPAKQAVDVDTSEGSRVWAQLDNNGNAIIIGS